MRFGAIDSDNTLLDGKSWENFLIYNTSYKTFMGAKLLRIRFDRIHGFIKTLDWPRYLVLFGPEIYSAIYGKINYTESEKTNIKYSINHIFAGIKVDSYNSLSVQKNIEYTIELTFLKELILIRQANQKVWHLLLLVFFK